MPLTLDAMLVQPSNSGSFNAASGAASLPNPTTADSTTLIAISTGGSIAPSSVTGHTNDFPSGAATARVFLYRKSNHAGGDTSWTITLTGAALCRWTVYEIDGLDPDFPVDVVKATSLQDTSTGTTASSGTTPRSTTYDGLVVALHGSYNSLTTTPTTFAGHTNGMVEMDEGSINDGVSQAVNLSVSMQTAQQLATWETTATASATLATTNRATSAIIVYSAKNARREANIEFFWGFKVGAGAAGLNTGVGGLSSSRYWDVQAGSPAITADGLQLTGSASIQNIQHAGLPSNPIAHVIRLRFRLDSVSGDLVLMPLPTLEILVVRYVSSSQKIGVKVGAGTEQVSDSTVTTGQWYNLDIRVRLTSTTRTVDWQFDYGAGPVTQTPATSTGSFTVDTLIPRLGWTAASTGTVTYAYALFSHIPGHYPLGDHTIVLLTPSGTPTVPGTVGNFAFITNNATGAALTSGTLANVPATIDDFPPTVGASADGFCVVTASATDYLEVPMATYNASGVGSIRAARVVIPVWAASGTTCTCKVQAYDGTTRTTLFAEANPTTDNSTTPGWICKMWRPTNGWTQAKLDAAAIDYGSADATPDNGPLAVGMEVAIQNAQALPVIGEAGSVLATADKDPVTGGILAVTVDTPAGESATLNWVAMGTPGSQTVAPASSYTAVFDAPDVTGVTFLEVVSDNEAPDRP